MAGSAAIRRAPNGLSARGRELWRAATAAPWITGTDTALLELVCREADTVEELRARCAADPDDWRLRTAFGAAVDRCARLLGLAGLTPHDRQRLGHGGEALTLEDAERRTLTALRAAAP